jgi:hypothetical protein
LPSANSSRYFVVPSTDTYFLAIFGVPTMQVACSIARNSRERSVIFAKSVTPRRWIQP